MEQEIKALLLINHVGAENSFKHKLQEELKQKLTNENTHISVAEAIKNQYKLCVHGSINAVYDLDLGVKTAARINDNLLQGLNLSFHDITVLSIKEEKDIYQNK